MNLGATQNTWIEANQHYLVAEFARLKLRLGAEGDAQVASAAVGEARAALPAPPAIDVLTDIFSLSPFERDVLLLCAGVEMDAGLARRCAEAQGFPQRTHATFGLALAALENPHWSALRPVGPLRRWRSVEVDDSAGLAQGRLRIDERILHYLAGVNYLDTRLQPLLRPKPRPDAMAEAHRRIRDSVLGTLRESSASPPVVLLIGDDLHGQADVAAQVALQLGLQLHVVRAEDLPQTTPELDAFAVLWEREAALLDSVLLVECREPEVPKPVMRLVDRAGSLIFIASREVLSVSRATLRFTVNKPDASEQKRLWEQALGQTVSRLNGSLDGVASQFRLSAQSILSTGKELRAALTVSDQPDATLWNAVRSLGRPKLDDLAQRIEPAAGWDDLILPGPQKAALHQIAAHARQRLRVYQEWGFGGKSARGLGIAALFAGESGTGKTMAAEVLASELHLDLYRIDLSSVVSKYIGETEKNLRRVFDAAEDSGAILLFDEADALFGKRSEVRDSHDRYANIEVSYLLQRMEAYRGLAILTTNMKSALDTAFQRRLRFVVHFPFPDQEHRLEIWRQIFPKATPVKALDYAKLARLHVAGGNIRNIALNAAFTAAEAGEPVSMSHLLQAAHSEAAKRERPLSDAETRGWI
jgi:ATPase family associated with various cellular activities (AAA)